MKSNNTIYSLKSNKGTVFLGVNNCGSYFDFLLFHFSPPQFQEKARPIYDEILNLRFIVKFFYGLPISCSAVVCLR